MTGYENPRITGGGERPRNLIHADIYAAFQATEAANAHALAAGYLQLANDWQAGLQVFTTSIQRSVASAWEGQAADAFVNAINRYGTEAASFETDLRALHSRVDQSAASVSATKYALPEPVEEKHPLHPDSWPVVGSNRDPVIEKQQEEAQAIMANQYVKPFVESYDTQVPVLSSPINPVTPYDIAAPTSGRTGSPGGGSPSGSGNGDGSGAANGGNGTDEDPGSPSQEPESDDGTTTPEQSPDTDDPSTSTDQDTSSETSEPTTTPQSTAPASTTPVGTPGSPTGAGAPGSGAPGSGSPASGVPGAGSPAVAGRVVPGVPGAVAPAASGSTGVSGASGGRGMPMGGMPMGGARGGQQDDDATRTTPDYLINQANTDELLGDELPSVANGGVIGAHLVPKDRS